jgi:hypothetical protein
MSGQSNPGPPDWQPGPPPEPPDDLADRQLPLLKAVPPWFQCYGIKRGALNFNPRSSGRFNAPDGEFATTYLSSSPEGAFAEKFLQSARHEGRGVNVISRGTLILHRLCRVSQPSGARPLNLVDLSGNGTAWIGADGRLSTLTDDPGLVQRWALALWRHPERPDGVFYRARHDLSCFSIAVFDRASALLVADTTADVLQDRVVLAGLVGRYRFGLVD